MYKKILVFLLVSFSILNASSVKIAAGAGYKKPLMDIIKEYEKDGKKIEPLFANMKQVSIQAKQTNLALIIGDKNFLAKKSGLEFKHFIKLGEGKVVIAYAKNKTINSLNDLANDAITRISMPQPQKAIYGIAGEEFLKNSSLYTKTKKKLYIVSTVPQAMSYVITNEVDAGIVNLTAALANKEKIGGYFEVPQEYYSKIEIVAGKLKACDTKECEDFIDFLQSKIAKDIFKKYGL